MNNPIHRAVGTKVKLTNNSFVNIINSNRSIKAYPSDDFIEKLKPFIGCFGIVTNDFSPSYDRTINFGTNYFHMKDNWVESAE